MIGLYTNLRCTVNDIVAADNGSHVLHIYGVVAYIEWQAWFNSVHRAIQPTDEPDIELDPSDKRVLLELVDVVASPSYEQHHLAIRAVQSMSLYIDGKFLESVHEAHLIIIP